MKTNSSRFRPVQGAVIALLAFVLVAGTFMTTFAGPTRNTTTAKLQTEVRNLIDSPSHLYGSNLSGEAEVFFTVDALGHLHVKGVFSTSDELAKYVETKLEDAVIRNAQPEPGTTFRMKLRLEDLR